MQGENVVEKKILNLLSKQIMSTSQVAKKINMRREVAAGYLEALMHQGKLEKTIVGKSNVYRTIGLRYKRKGKVYKEEIYIAGKQDNIAVGEA